MNYEILPHISDYRVVGDYIIGIRHSPDKVGQEHIEYDHKNSYGFFVVNTVTHQKWLGMTRVQAEEKLRGFGFEGYQYNPTWSIVPNWLSPAYTSP